MHYLPLWLHRSRPVSRPPGNDGVVGVLLRDFHVECPSPEPNQGPHHHPLAINDSVWTLIDVYLRWVCGLLWLAAFITAVFLSVVRGKSAPFVYFSLFFVFFNVLISYWAWWFKRVDPKCLGVFDLIVTGTLLGAIFGTIWILGCSETKIDFLSCTLDPVTLSLFVEINCLTAIYITLMICAYIAFLIRYRRKKQERNVWKTAHPRLRILTTDEGHAAAAQEAEDLRYKYETRQTKWYTDLRLIPRVGWWKH